MSLWSLPSAGLHSSRCAAFIALLTTCAAFAATKYVAVSGHDANDGDSPRTAYRTIAHGLKNIGAGGRLLIGGGTYAEALLNAIPSGPSDDERTTVTNWPGETVVIRPERGPARVLEFATASRNITIAALAPGQIVLDGALVAHNVVKFSALASDALAERPAYIRLENLEIKHGRDSAVLGLAQSCEFFHLAIHDSGTTVFDHGMYITGADNLIEACDVHHNFSRGIQIYMEGKRGDAGFASRNTVRGCRIHDNGRGDPTALKPGIDVDSGVGNLIYNNLIYDNGQFGLVIQSGGTGAVIANNTFFQNGGAAVSIRRTSGARNVVVNNLGWQNGDGAGWTNERDDTVASHNSWTVDPHFATTDPANAAFLQLTAESRVAIDQGTAEPPIASMVTRDYFGAARTAAAGHDIGAAEYVPSRPAAVDSSSSRQ